MCIIRSQRESKHGIFVVYRLSCRYKRCLFRGKVFSYRILANGLLVQCGKILQSETFYPLQFMRVDSLSITPKTTDGTAINISVTEDYGNKFVCKLKWTFDGAYGTGIPQGSRYLAIGF